MPLSSLCRLFLPPPSDTELLRVCLWNDVAAQNSFAAWSRSSAYAEVQTGIGAKRRMLPLLNAALLRAKLAPPAQIRSMLRASQMYEELRALAYGEIAGNVLETLRVAEIPFLAVGGVSFSLNLYEIEELRHCHDLDLLMNEESLASAAEVLVRQCDFKMEQSTQNMRQEWILYHSSGLPVMLHGCSHKMPAYQFSFAELQQRAVLQRGYGTKFLTLSPEDGWLHLVLLAATSTQRASLIWAVDAWKLVASGNMDWAQLIQRTAGKVAMIPALDTLEYLADTLLAPVPPDVLYQLRSAKTMWKPVVRLQAEKTMLYGLQGSFCGGRKVLLQRAKGWKLRLRLLSLMLFPSTTTLRNAGIVQSSFEVPFFWIKRARRGLARSVRLQMRAGMDGTLR